MDKYNNCERAIKVNIQSMRVFAKTRNLKPNTRYMKLHH